MSNLLTNFIHRLLLAAALVCFCVKHKLGVTLKKDPPSVRTSEDLRKVRQKQQEAMEKAALEAAKKPKHSPSGDKKKETAGQIFSWLDDEKKNKKKMSGSYNHLLGQQTANYRPAKRTARRG